MNLNLIKQSVFKVLNDDTTLQGLLKASGRIHRQSPPIDVKYPCITYECTSNDNPYNQNDSSGKIVEALLIITIFSNEAADTESDNIEARIKTLLHGQNEDLTNDSIICYSCYRIGVGSQRKDPQHNIWVTIPSYRIRWATK